MAVIFKTYAKYIKEYFLKNSLSIYQNNKQTDLERDTEKYNRIFLDFPQFSRQIS